MQTNRDYFSWSQYSLWKSSKNQFYKRYVLGEDSPKTKEFDKGKEFADYKETGLIPHYVDDPLLETVALAVENPDFSEFEINTEFGEYKLKAFLDGAYEGLNHFVEYKTGRIPWTAEEVLMHEQLDFYALCIYLLSNETIIPTCKLYWIETEFQTINGEEVLRYTGSVEVFERTFTEEDITNMATKVYTVLKEIEAWEYKEINIDDQLVDRYIQLTADKKAIEDEINLIKLEVMTALENNQVKYGMSERGKFTLSERQNYVYSSDLINKEKEYKSEIDLLKKKEKDNGTAKITISTTLLFNMFNK